MYNTKRSDLEKFLRGKPDEVKKYILDQYDETGKFNPDTLLALGTINTKGELHDILLLAGLKFDSLEYYQYYDGYTENHELEY